MSISISIGRYGGFYVFSGFTKRICLGWIALTFYPFDIDGLIRNARKDKAER